MEDSITTPAKSGHTLFLGRQGENLARRIAFDLTAWLEAYGEGQAALAVMRSGDTLPYPASDIRTEGNTLLWTPTAADTARAGYGKCELRWYVGDVLAKSELWMTLTADALGSTGETPDPAEDYIAAMQRIGSAVQEAQTHAPHIGENGNWWLWDTETEAFTDSNFPARGSSGAQGPKGDRGETGTIPDSAWIKKTAAGDPVVFSDGADGEPVRSLIVSVVPTQSGEGTPTPDNVRPFLGRTEAVITVSPAAGSQDSVTYPVSFGEAGTVYGGGTLNVTTGVFTRKYVRARLSPAYTWYRQEISGAYYFCSAQLKEAMQTYKNLLGCTHFKSNGNTSAIGTNADLTVRNAYGRYYPLNIRYDALTTVAQWNTFLTNNTVYVVYETDPTELQLTPTEVKTLLGENHIRADAGTVQVTYRADAALAHALQENELAAVRAMLAGVEASDTATKNYTAGELLISGDTLYQVTANIASGGAITEGVNVSETTVAGQIALAAASGGGGGSINVDSALSASSTNPVQNKVIKAALDGKGATTAIPASGSVSNAGVLSFSNSAGTQLFSVQLPLYAGGVD